MSQSNVFLLTITLYIAVCVCSSVAEAASTKLGAQDDPDISLDDILDPAKVEEILLSFGSELEKMENVDPAKVEEILLSFGSELEKMENVKEVTNDIQQNKANVGCSCSGLQCRCCHYINLSKIHFQKQCCVVVDYFLSSAVVRVSFTAGSRCLYKHDFSIRHLRQICIPLKLKAKACFELYDVRQWGRCMSACTRASFYLWRIKLFNVDLGCFQINAVDGETGPTAAIEMTDMAVQEDTEDPKKLLFKALLFKSLLQTKNGIESETYDTDVV